MKALNVVAAIGCSALVLVMGGCFWACGRIGARVEQDKHAAAVAAEAHEAERRKAADPVYGMVPETGYALQSTIEQHLKEQANDPASVADLVLYRPEKDARGKVKCWRVDFTYRAKNALGALIRCHGAIWLRDDTPLDIKAQI